MSKWICNWNKIVLAWKHGSNLAGEARSIIKSILYQSFSVIMRICGPRRLISRSDEAWALMKDWWLIYWRSFCHQPPKPAAACQAEISDAFIMALSWKWRRPSSRGSEYRRLAGASFISIESLFFGDILIDAGWDIDVAACWWNDMK